MGLNNLKLNKMGLKNLKAPKKNSLHFAAAIKNIATELIKRIYIYIYKYINIYKYRKQSRSIRESSRSPCERKVVAVQSVLIVLSPRGSKDLF